MKKILPHEIDGFVRGETTYKQAVKLLGKPPFKPETNAAGKRVRWSDKQSSGHHTVYRDIDAQFDANDVLQDYKVHHRPVPMFGLGFR